MTRELIDDFSQKEVQEIEAAAQRKKKKGKSVARGEEMMIFQNLMILRIMIL